MDWVAFENDRKFVLEGLRHGQVDYVEHVSEAAEADLFRHLVSRDVLTLRHSRELTHSCFPKLIQTF